MASHTGLYDAEYNKRAINDPEVNPKGEMDPDWSVVTVAAATDTVEYQFYQPMLPRKTTVTVMY